jgi:hypothetical protein
MKGFTTAVLGAACALIVSATAASADIVCNREGDCWHVNAKHPYHGEWGLVIHPDSWKWEEHEKSKFRWREHEGRGYWHKGVWIEF